MTKKLSAPLETEGKIIFTASSIGHPCMRKIWIGNVQGTEEVFTKATLRIFDMGSHLEELVIKWMREDGWEVAANPGGRKAKFLTVVNANDKVQIHGHHDAIARIPGEKTAYMFDIKTMNSRAYDYWRKLGTLEKYPQYAQQVHVYAKPDEIYELDAVETIENFKGEAEEVEYYSKCGPYFIPNCGIVGLNKDNGDYDIDKFPFMDEIYADVIAKALAIASHTTIPPLDKSIPKWCCSYCGYKREGICPGV